MLMYGKKMRMENIAYGTVNMFVNIVSLDDNYSVISGLSAFEKITGKE